MTPAAATGKTTDPGRNVRRTGEGTEDKKEKEKLKKIQRYRKKKLLQSKTSRKANKHMIGLGPIRRQSISFFHDITSDFEEAKVMAVNEFLCEYLQLTEEDIKDFNIVETMLAKNEDDLVYVTLSDHESIREIYRRTADLKNDEIMTRIFVPPNFGNDTDVSVSTALNFVKTIKTSRQRSASVKMTSK